MCTYVNDHLNQLAHNVEAYDSSLLSATFYDMLYIKLTHEW